MEIAIAQRLIDDLLSEAASAHPRECCGILLGSDGRIDAIRPARNVHPEPERYFEIDPQTLIDAHRAARRGGEQVIGYYHSHPAGPAAPSATDAQMAAGDGAVWAIVGEGDIRFWQDGENGFEPLSYMPLNG